MTIKIIREKVTKETLEKMGKEFFDHMIKGVVDVRRKIMAVGGEFHSDAATRYLGV